MVDAIEERIRRIEEILARVAAGDLTPKVELGGSEDVLTGLEMGINFLIVDLRTNSAAIKEKEERLIAQRKELEQRLATIEEQAQAIREMSTPVLEVWDDVLVVPVIGVVDTHRGATIMEAVLGRLSTAQARCVVIDVTGVPFLDTSTADHLLKVVSAASLLGAECVLTGVSPAVAQTVVSVGVDLGKLVTLRNLKAGLRYCLDGLRRSGGTRLAAVRP
jgi:rsbT co-antagonist protein RsbR